MTALAVGLALVPLVISGNIPGQEIARPIAIVILGGLVTSTALNLFIIPTLYLGFGASSQALASMKIPQVQLDENSASSI